MSNIKVIELKGMVEIVILDFKPGSLVFYSKHTAEFISKGFNPVFGNNLYWKDANSPHGFGPFATLEQAMKNHAETTKIDRSKDVQNVMFVDFKNKKLIK